MAKITPEGAVKKQVCAFLDARAPQVWYYMPVQMGYGKSVHDFIVCWYGLFISIETKSLKTPTGRAGMTVRQKQTATDIRNARGVVLEVNEENIADTFLYLSELVAAQQLENTTLSQRMRDAGFTPRVTVKNALGFISEEE